MGHRSDHSDESRFELIALAVGVSVGIALHSIALGVAVAILLYASHRPHGNKGGE